MSGPERHGGLWLRTGEHLSERQEAVVRGLTRGDTLLQIADDLGLSRTVVEHEAMWLRRRLGLRNNNHLSAWGAARGLSAFREQGG